MNKPISAEDYEVFRRFLEEACGITLGDHKAYLVTSRLQRVMEEFRITDLRQLVAGLDDQRNSRLRVRIIDAMTTNETLWFRDFYPFEVLRDEIFPELDSIRTRPVRIWSTACSTGQEPYSVSIAAQEYLQARTGVFAGGLQIVATDISSSALEQARSGLYEQAALARGVSEQRRNRFFAHVGDKWRIRPEVQQRVTFSELNLKQSYAALGRFDVIFCRNVLIYFSSDLKRDILQRLAQSLTARGYLFLGSSESLAGFSDAFDMIRRPSGVYYRRKH